MNTWPKFCDGVIEVPFPLRTSGPNCRRRQTSLSVSVIHLELTLENSLHFVVGAPP
jgi:hypothetical protein